MQANKLICRTSYYKVYAMHIQNTFISTNLDSNKCDEIKGLIKLRFITGIIQKPNLKMYWSEDWVFLTVNFSETISWNWFQNIISFLHFSENSEYNSSTDRLYKNRPILLKCSEKFWILYTPEQNIALLNKNMLGRREGFWFHVYNSEKKSQNTEYF